MNTTLNDHIGSTQETYVIKTCQTCQAHFIQTAV